MLTIALNALQGIFSIIFIISIGYTLAKRNWFDEKSSKVLANLVVNVSLPLYMITNMTKNFTKDNLLSMGTDLIVPFLSVILALIIGKIVASFIKVKEGRKGVFVTNFYIANTMFIGLPVNLALFGEKSIPAVMLYYIVNTIMFWTLGVQNILEDTEEGRKENAVKTLVNKNVLSKLASPPLVGFAIGIIFVLLEIKLPHFINESFRYVGSMTTPLSLIFVGIEMSKIKISTIEFDSDIIWSIMGRFLVCPLCVLIFIPFINIDPLVAKVFVLQAAMPTMTQMTIVAKNYGADAKYAAMLSLITVLAGIFVIPIYMILVTKIIGV